MSPSESELIYESGAIERLAVEKQTSADAYANAWLIAVSRTPEMASDRETVLSWFAVAIEAGRAAGSI